MKELNLTMKTSITMLLTMLIVFASCSNKEEINKEIVTEEYLKDKINGGIIGQFFGNLNGLIHENKYTDEPGNVTTYVPDLSEGAFADDDTDIEFVYIYHMNLANEVILPYHKIYDLWIENITEHIWCSNRYARNLMDLGFSPPYTGRVAFNPWAMFNISGQFLCEQFALISPGMPQTAGRIGTHYTHVAVDGEPIQTTQLFTAMIATAFFENDYMKVIEAGLAATDPNSEIHSIVSNTIKWYNENPDDWKITRKAIKDRYWNGVFGGPSGSNGYRIITAATMASLLYGKGDFVEAVKTAFNFGWDADNISAMVGTIMGTFKGEKWLRSQGWKIKDAYVNDRRPGLPAFLTITEFADLHLNLAKQVILANGGEQIEIDGKPGYKIKIQEPENIEPIPTPLHRAKELREMFWPSIQNRLTGDETDKANAVYAAMCLDLVNEIATEKPIEWKAALDAFKPHYEKLVSDMWSESAANYFHDVIYNENVTPECPFGYGIFTGI